MPEHPQQVTEHEQYEALCALAAGGLLEGPEFADFQAHLKQCSECRSDYRELSDLVTGELPHGQGTVRQKLAAITAKPLPGSRQRFLRRARAEGVAFSREVETPARSRSWYFRPFPGLVGATVVVAAVVSFAVYHFRVDPNPEQSNSAASRQIAELQRQNAELTASLSQANQSLAAQQTKIENLRTEVANAATMAKNLRRDGEQAQAEAERSSSHEAELMQESRNEANLLAEAREEAARSSQLHVDNEVSLVEQQTRINDLTDKLRIASATLDMERQLAATGKDVRELLAARELHVIDVRGDGPNGKPNAFGRVFLTEGKSLTFYAFDLNQESATQSKQVFQVWAVAASGKNASRSLGFLRADAKAPGRWVLKVDRPELVSQISAVFVTADPGSGDKEPGTQKMLYAFLGEANHP